MPILILFAEIILVYYFVQFFGFLNFLLFYAVTMFIGIIIVRAVGFKSLREFQTGTVSASNRSMISRGLLFVSGLLLIVPSMGTKICGAVLFFPPVRWLVAVGFTNFLLKRVFNANSFVHQFGSGNFRFYYQGSQSRGPFQNQNTTTEQSGDVIDAEFRKIDDPKLLK